MRPLGRKLLRDAWHYRGQFAAIMAVVVCGVALFVALRSMNGFLRGSRDRFYMEYRFADVFAPIVAAPLAEARTIETIAGIRSAEARIVVDVTANVEALPEPAITRLISVPVPRTGHINELHLEAGRWPMVDRPLEVIASVAFARANALAPGDSIGAVLNGRWEWLRIVGLGISPEYVYEVRSGAVFPDNRRFGVVWIGRDALARAFNLYGAFNDLVVELRPGASEMAVIAELDRVLNRYGAVGAYGRRVQMSSLFVDGEIEETQVTSVLLPAIFLAVTAFLVHVALARLVGTQREQIAMLKAFGYPNRSIGLHYLLLAVVPVVAGSVVGAVVGIAFAARLARIYVRFFQFPSAQFVPDAGVVGLAIVIGLAAGVVGALMAVMKGVRLPPAEAMHPEAPPRFRPGPLERLAIFRRVSTTTHLIARNLERRPARAALTVTGLALAVGMVVTTMSLFDAIDYMKDIQFRRITRADATIGFESARPVTALTAVRRLPGVVRVEGIRTVPVRMRFRNRSHQTAILGLPSDAELYAIVDDEGRSHRPPTAGLLVSEILARRLAVRAGDEVLAEVIEGDRRTLRLTVTGISRDLIGALAYMQLDALSARLGDGGAVTGALVMVDPRESDRFYREVKRLPAVGTVSVRDAELEGFEATIAESFNTSLATMLGFACVIAFGVVYNSARVALSERGRELASLRVLGFTRAEVGRLLLGEQAVLALVALPVGFGFAYSLAWLIAERFASDLFRIPVIIRASSFAFGTAVLVLAAALSVAAIRGRIVRLDIVGVLKTRE